MTSFKEIFVNIRSVSTVGTIRLKVAPITKHHVESDVYIALYVMNINKRQTRTF